MNRAVSNLRPTAALVARMRRIRRILHSHPELAFGEKRTGDLISAFLDELDIPYQRGVAGTGIIATLEGQTRGEQGDTVALRADMDALPIAENTGLDFASGIPGVMHACGHDGHVAMLLGAAALLRETPPVRGRIVLLFQPAEESGNGALKMIRAGVLENVNMIFAGHIDTHYPVGTFTVDEGVVCSYSDPFTIRIIGRGGHAARPHEAVDSVVVAANLIMSMQTLISRRIDPSRAAVVTIGKLRAGNVHNAIAEEALLEGTIRSTHPETRKEIHHGLNQVIQGSSEMCNARITLSFFDNLPAVINEPRATALARQGAGLVVGANRVLSQGNPSLGGEDFAFYLQKVPGCLVRFGAATGDPATGPAHSSGFDFDEDVLPLGAAWLANIALLALDSPLTS